MRTALLLAAVLALPAAADEDPPEEAPAEETQTAPTVPHRAFRQRPAAGRPASPPPADEAGDAGIQGGGQALGGQGIQSGGEDGTTRSSGASSPGSGGAGQGSGAAHDPGAKAAAGDYTVIDLDKLPCDAGPCAHGHRRINLSRGPYAIRFNSGRYPGKVIVAQTSDVPPNIGSDVLFIAAVGTKPGDFSMGKACRIKGVHGGLGRRTQSEIMMVGDPGPDEPLTRPDLRGNPVPSSWALTKRMVERGEICLLRPDTEYFYSIAGDCDWGRIESQRERLGKEPNGPKHGCPVRLSNNNFFLLAPGRNQERK